MPPPVSPSLQLDGEEAEADPDDEEPIRPRLKLRKSDTLKDDLTEMVGSDPDAAAAILRAWINNRTRRRQRSRLASLKRRSSLDGDRHRKHVTQSGRARPESR